MAEFKNFDEAQRDLFQNLMAKELLEKFEYKKDLATECCNQVISACEYNDVESYNTEWWNKVIEKIKSL